MKPVLKYVEASRPFIASPDDITVELAILQRETLARIHARIAAQQLGEAFAGLDTDQRSS